MFKPTEVERKMREIYLLISLRVELYNIISHCISRDCYGTHYELKIYHLDMRKMFGKYTNHGSRKDVVEITLCISS